MAVINVGGMHCNGCVARIEKRLKTEGLTFKVSLENKTVAVDGNEDDINKAKECIEELGFEVN